ncbi:hypothetical protein Plhal304r1_c023g0079661 [Plasmopara halstedii]
MIREAEDQENDDQENEDVEKQIVTSLEKSERLAITALLPDMTNPTDRVVLRRVRELQKSL